MSAMTKSEAHILMIATEVAANMRKLMPDLDESECITFATLFVAAKFGLKMQQSDLVRDCMKEELKFGEACATNPQTP